MSKTLDKLNAAKKARNCMISPHLASSHIENDITIAGNEARTTNHAFAILSILLIVFLIASVVLNYFFFVGLNKLSQDKTSLSEKLDEIADKTDTISRQINKKIDKQSDELNKIQQLAESQSAQLSTAIKDIEENNSTVKSLSEKLGETQARLSKIEESDKEQNVAIEGINKAQP